MVNKQLFFDPKLTETTRFPYITAEIRDINIKLSENKLHFDLLQSAYLKFAKLQYVSSGFRCRVITRSLMRRY